MRCQLMRDILNLTKKDFRDIPHRGWAKDVYCDSIVIIPEAEMHDSGFRCMQIVAMEGDTPVYKCAGGSDAIHINGIGGYGELNSEAYKTAFSSGCRLVPVTSWTIDMLPCGYVRLFTRGKIKVGAALSDLEIMPVKDYTEEGTTVDLDEKEE